MTTPESKAQRCAIYARVSSDAQRNQGTIRGQVERLTQVAESRGWEIVLTAEDDGVSGTIDPWQRRGMQRVLTLVDAREVDVVLVSALDRISRDEDGIALPMFNKRLRDAGVALWTPEQKIESDSAEQRLWLGFMNVFASFERSKITTRTKAGRERAIRKGGRPRAPTIVGYAWNSSTRQHEPDPDGRRLVEEAFRLAASGESLYAISRALKQAGLKGPKGKFVHETTIADLIRREVYYTGRYTPERIDGEPIERHVDPLVDEATWAAANESIRHRPSAPERSTTYPFLLRGLVFCAACGRKMRAQCTNGRHAYYRCDAGVQDPLNKSRCAARTAIRADELDPEVWDQVVELIRDPRALRAAMLREAASTDADAAEARIAELEGQLASLDAQRKRLLDAVQSGAIAGAEVGDRMRDLRAGISRHESAIAELKRQSHRHMAESVRLELADSRRESWMRVIVAPEPEEQQELLKQVVRKVSLDIPNGLVDVHVFSMFDDGQADAGGTTPGPKGKKPGSVGGSEFYGNESSLR